MEDDTERWLGDSWKFDCEKGQWPPYQEGSWLLCVGIKENHEKYSCGSWHPGPEWIRDLSVINFNPFRGVLIISYRTGGRWFESQQGKNNSHRQNTQTGPGAHLASYSMCNGVLFRVQSDLDMRLPTHFHLAQRLRVTGVVFPLSTKHV